MKTKHLLTAASALLLTATSHATSAVRWLGIDMNTNVQSTSTALVHVDTTQFFFGPLSLLASLPFGAGPDLMPYTGSTGVVTSGTSHAQTDWAINPSTDQFLLQLNHGVGGTALPNNFAGVEGVLYFYALTPGTITVTYDYGTPESFDSANPFKPEERGTSRGNCKNNFRGLGDDATGATEIWNRDGSRTFSLGVGPSSDLNALQFDFQINAPLDANEPNGYLTMNFTPAPEPTSAALLGLGGLAMLARRRRVG